MQTNVSKANYADGLLNTQRLIVVIDFILRHDSILDKYLQHLHSIKHQEKWSEFRPVILEAIEEYDVSDDEVEEFLKSTRSKIKLC